MDFIGKVMRGFLFISPEGFDTDAALDFWVAKALEFRKENEADPRMRISFAFHPIPSDFVLNNQYEQETPPLLQNPGTQRQDFHVFLYLYLWGRKDPSV